MGDAFLWRNMIGLGVFLGLARCDSEGGFRRRIEPAVRQVWHYLGQSRPRVGRCL
jgi:hypothetical protein